MSRIAPAVALAVALALPHPGGALTVQQPGETAVTTVVQDAGTVNGVAWRRDDSPVPHARLRLREVSAGRIAAATQADAAGRFQFTRVAPGTYLVELVDDEGRIRAVSQTFTLAPRDTVATFVRLGADPPWYSGFFTNAAIAALATAATLGITALGDGGQPASAQF